MTAKCEQCGDRSGVRIQRGRGLCLNCAETDNTFTSAGNLPCPKCKNPTCQDELHLIRGARVVRKVNKRAALAA